MSKFQIADETIVALWNGLALELDPFYLTGHVSGDVLKLARRDFFRMLANFPQHVLAGVTDIAPGTGEPVLRIVVSDRYKRHATLAAKRRMGAVAH